MGKGEEQVEGGVGEGEGGESVEVENSEEAVRMRQDHERMIRVIEDWESIIARGESGSRRSRSSRRGPQRKKRGKRKNFRYEWTSTAEK